MTTAVAIIIGVAAAGLFGLAYAFCAWPSPAYRIAFNALGIASWVFLALVALLHGVQVLWLVVALQAPLVLGGFVNAVRKSRAKRSRSGGRKRDESGKGVTH